MTDWGVASVTAHQYEANSSDALISPFSNHSNCNRHCSFIAQEEGIQGSAVRAFFPVDENQIAMFGIIP
jgi:hypothetical protein